MDDLGVPLFSETSIYSCRKISNKKDIGISADIPGHMSPRFSRQACWDPVGVGQSQATRWCWDCLVEFSELDLDMPWNASSCQKELEVYTIYLYIYICIYIYVYIYIYISQIPGTCLICLPSILGLQPCKRRPFPIHTGVIWVPGMYGCI